MSRQTRPYITRGVRGASDADEPARGGRPGLQIEQRARANRPGAAVVIDAAASGDPEARAADLRALGAENVALFGRMVPGRLPITAIPALDDLLTVRPPAYATTNEGEVTSQGDRAMRAEFRYYLL